MFNRKPLIIAAVAAATVSVTTLSSQAYANDDALLGAIVGAGVGAAIGHNVHGRDGAVVGSAIGAIAGASIAASSQSYYDSGYYVAPSTAYVPAPVYYGTASAYYPAAPIYYPRPRVSYAPRFDYVHYGSRHVDHGRSDDHGRPNGRSNDDYQRR